VSSWVLSFLAVYLLSPLLNYSTIRDGISLL
jgi:hypothetical protein